MRVRLALVLLAAVLVGCEGGTVVVRVDAPPPPGPPVVVVEPPAAPAGALLAKEIKADYVRARAIYAREVKTSELRVGQVVRVHDREARGWGRGESIRAGSVVGDEIYAGEVKARVVEAGILYVHELKVGH